MNLLRPILRIGSRFQEIEFSLLLAWALFFPAKQSHLYYFGFAALLVVFSLKKIFTLKNISSMRFSLFMLLFNLLLAGSAFFSPHPWRSLLFASDVFLISLWFFLFEIELIDVGRYLRLLANLLSISSLAIIIFFAARAGNGPQGIIFTNPILQGIAAALAALFFLQSLLHKFSYPDLALLVIHVAAVVISASKAAFLGLAVLAAAMILARKKKWLAYFAALLLLLALLPNPLRQKVGSSLQRDPYVYDRLQIWNMSARMFRAHPWTGVGPDLFSEAARRFNFPQEKGPSRYGKLPESPHSDYWKVITETGLAGLLFVLLFLVFVIRRMPTPLGSAGPAVLLAFLLLQMLLFNFIFNSFFLLLFFFLLYSFFWRRLSFVALTPTFRIVFSGLLFLIFFIFYLLPLVTDQLLQAAATEKNIARRFTMLNRAALCSPLNEQVPLARAKILRDFFRASANLEAWEAAREDLHHAQMLDRHNSDAYILESGLFADMLEKKIVYPALAEEILAPLRRAAALEPLNPFLKMRQALVLARFGRHSEARRLAREALKLEPEFVEALFFLQREAGAPAADPGFQKRMAQIQARANKINPKPGTYLYDLYRVPGKSKAQ